MSPRTHTQWEEIRGKSREKILNAAIYLFSSVGYFSTSVSKIAQKAGVSKGLLYNYFDSKDQLLIAIVNKTLNLIEKAFDISTDDRPPEESLILLMENMFKIIENHQGFLRMIIPLSMQIREFEFINKMIFNKYDESVEKISSILKTLNYEDHEDEARIIIAGLDGIMYQYLVMGDNFPYEKIKNALINKYKV